MTMTICRLTYSHCVSVWQMLGETRFATQAQLSICACAGGVASVYFAGAVQV